MTGGGSGRVRVTWKTSSADAAEAARRAGTWVRRRVTDLHNGGLNWLSRSSTRPRQPPRRAVVMIKTAFGGSLDSWRSPKSAWARYDVITNRSMFEALRRTLVSFESITAGFAPRQAPPQVVPTPAGLESELGASAPVPEAQGALSNRARRRRRDARC